MSPEIAGVLATAAEMIAAPDMDKAQRARLVDRLLSVQRNSFYIIAALSLPVTSAADRALAARTLKECAASADKLE